jgi:DNA helicase-2/ATP-dependent DNA helicase PcrA
MSAPWLEGLNPSQCEAVTHGEGPLLVVAGAGTGKTKTLACRVACLIDRGVPPERILLLTFTRRAAAEMLRRAGQMVGQKATGKVWGGTFHAVANRLLRIYGQAVGLATDFTVMDQADAADMMNLIRNELGLASTDRRFPRKATLVSIYSRTVNAQDKLDAVLARHFPWCQGDIDGIREIFKRYTERKPESHLVDYDDLLLYWSMLCGAPQVGEMVADRFDHVLVDEYQDTNAIQAEILRGMRRRKKNIMVVGDDAQSIYSFRAASVRNILDFPKHFEGTTAVTLEQNYRSTLPILAASNAVMAHAHERYTKDLWSERASEQRPVLITCQDELEQCAVVCESVLTHREQGIDLHSQAVLFRAGHHSDQLEVELARRNIPFHKYGGLKFVEAAHVKDMLAILRILENPYDEVSWFRVLLMLEGVGSKFAWRIMTALGVRGNGNEASPLVRLFECPPKVPSSAEKSFGELSAAVADCLGRVNGKPSARDDEDADALPVAAQVERVRRFYEPIFERSYENPKMRMRDIEQLEQIAARYRSRGRFITDLTLDPPNATQDLAQPPHLDDDYLVLSTMHSAKGCEWDVVHIIHATDGMIPSDMAVGDEAGVDEERRLFYVAMTRAKDWLYVYVPLRYYRRRGGLGDGHSYAQRTRFLTDDVLRLFEERTIEPEPGQADEAPFTTLRTPEDVHRWLDERW